MQPRYQPPHSRKPRKISGFTRAAAGGLASDLTRVSPQPATVGGSSTPPSYLVVVAHAAVSGSTDPLPSGPNENSALPRRYAMHAGVETCVRTGSAAGAIIWPPAGTGMPDAWTGNLGAWLARGGLAVSGDR